MKKGMVIAIIAVVIAIIIVTGFFKLTGNALWEWSHCTPENKCPAGEGDCDSGRDCLTNFCQTNVGVLYGQSKYLDVCAEK